MTGYGSGEAAAKGARIAVEISSINRKQLDIRVGLPGSAFVLEARIHEVIHEHLTRGRVSVDVQASLANGRKGKTIRIDRELAADYLAALRKTAAQLDMPDDFSGSLLLSLPNVVSYDEPAADMEALWPLVHKALRAAIRDLMASKTAEGNALRKDLEKRLAELGRLLKRIAARAPRVVKRHRESLMKRLGSAGVSVGLQDDRLLKELALFADRSDITEETTRLGSHLEQATKLMDGKPPTGKSLDFLAQEMFREINTIGAKANDAHILSYVVRFKAELERIREQVQNIE
jgi:uncharacterized protein (TIGR00255 family)